MHPLPACDEFDGAGGAVAGAVDSGLRAQLFDEDDGHLRALLGQADVLRLNSEDVAILGRNVGDVAVTDVVLAALTSWAGSASRPGISSKAEVRDAVPPQV